MAVSPREHPLKFTLCIWNSSSICCTCVSCHSEQSRGHSKANQPPLATTTLASILKLCSSFLNTTSCVSLSRRALACFLFMCCQGVPAVHGREAQTSAAVDSLAAFTALLSPTSVVKSSSMVIRCTWHSSPPELPNSEFTEVQASIRVLRGAAAGVASSAFSGAFLRSACSGPGAALLRSFASALGAFVRSLSPSDSRAVLRSRFSDFLFFFSSFFVLLRSASSAMASSL